MAGTKVELPHSEEPVDNDSDNGKRLLHPRVVDEGDEREDRRDVVAGMEVHPTHNDEENVEWNDGHHKTKEEWMVLAPYAVTNPNTMVIYHKRIKWIKQ